MSASLFRKFSASPTAAGGPPALPATASLLVAFAFALAGCPAQPKPDEPVTQPAVTQAEPPKPVEVAKAPEPEKQAEPEKPKEEEKPKEDVHPLQPEVREAFDDGMKAIVGGDPDKALKAFKEAASDDPRTYWAHYNLALLYERKEDVVNAEREYLKTLDLKPEADRAAENYAKLLVRLGRSSEAEKTLRARLDKSPKALGLGNALAWVLFLEGQLEPSATEAKKVLKIDEQNARAMFVLANVYYKQGKSELAMMVLENAAAIDKNRPEIPNMQGVILLGQKKKQPARDKFAEAAAMREDFPEAHNNLGAMLLAAQLWQDAIRELELTVKYAPKFAQAHVNLGNAYRGAGDVEKAKTEYNAAMQLDPSLAPDIYFNLGVLFMDAEVKGMDISARMTEALSYFGKVKEAGKGDELIAQYEKDANKALDKEKRRKEREERDKVRAQKKAEEDAKKAAEEAEKKKADEEKARAEAEKKAIEDAKKAEADKAAAEKKAADEAKKAEAQRLLDEKKAAEQAKKDEAKRAAEAKKEEAKRLAEEKKAAEEAKKHPKKTPAGKLGDDEGAAPAPAPKKPAGKLGDDEDAAAPAPSKPAPAPAPAAKPASTGKLGDD